MTVVLLGVNHKTAPVAVRERLAFGEEGLLDFLRRLKGLETVEECAILSTCNRTELYASSPDADRCRQGLAEFMATSRGLDPSEFLPHLFTSQGPEAVGHLFEVSSGLDSMILGENQILAQVRTAWERARGADVTGPVLDKLFPWAVRVGKRARSQTRINEGAASVSHAAVELARMIFGDLAKRPVLVLGAGEMSELTLKHLVNSGVNQLSIANRTAQRAHALAERCGGRAVPFEDLDRALEECDILVSSTGAPHYVVTRERLAKVMRARRNRPLFMVDIAVPRDIEPSCEELESVYLYNIDDLNQAVAKNLSRRHKEVARVLEIVRQETQDFVRDLEARRAVPAIRRLRDHFETVRLLELERAAARGVPEEEARRLDAFSRALIHKLLHQPTLRLRELGAAGMEADELTRSLEIFGLAQEGEPVADEDASWT